MPDLQYEIAHYKKNLRPIGVDEVGRGCLAGPVVAASALLPESLLKDPSLVDGTLWAELDDSKKLTPRKRDELAKFIRENAAVEVAWVMPEEIDRINILQASMFAMRKSLARFSQVAGAVLVDGNQDPFDKYFLLKGEQGESTFAVETIVKGDSHSLSIAAASIVAKVFRDNWMEEYDRQFPGYGFAKHKGYSTRMHYDAISRLGPCAIHRMSFAPLKGV